MDWPGGSWEATARLAGTLVGIYLLALWLSALVWTYRDIRDRSNSIAFQVAAVLLVFLFNLAGLFIYLIVRPRETLAEAYVRALEEEAMLQELEEGGTCPNCHRHMEADFFVCPFCTTTLKDPCVHCGKPLLPGWAACPYCGTIRRPAAVKAGGLALASSESAAPWRDEAEGGPEPGPKAASAQNRSRTARRRAAAPTDDQAAAPEQAAKTPREDS